VFSERMRRGRDGVKRATSPEEEVGRGGGGGEGVRRRDEGRNWCQPSMPIAVKLKKVLWDQDDSAHAALLKDLLLLLLLLLLVQGGGSSSSKQERKQQHFFWTFCAQKKNSKREIRCLQFCLQFETKSWYYKIRLKQFSCVPLVLEQNKPYFCSLAEKAESR
jgi:hypothetical protein